MPYRGFINFRDVGGHRTVHGSAMRTGLVFRSGRLELLDFAHGRQLVDELGVRTVIDLRTGAECDAAGQADLYLWQPALRRLHIPYVSSLRHPPPGATSLHRTWEPSDVARRYVAATIERGRFRLVELVRILADPATGPAVVHCWSGKDRTGLVAAIVQSVAAYRPRSETMSLTLLGLRAQFGSLEQMLIESGAAPSDLDRLRQRLLD